MRSMCLICAFALTWLAISCSQSAPESETGGGDGLGTLSFEREGSSLLRLEIEIAETPEMRAKGLMGVKSLSRNRGMAFLFSSPNRSSFWMHDTLIPLDIAFWGTDGRVVDVFQMEPCIQDPCPSFTPKADYIGAVEANKDRLVGAGIRDGDLVKLER